MFKVCGLRKETDYFDGKQKDYIVKKVFATVPDFEDAKKLAVRHYQNIESHNLNFQAVTLEDDGKVFNCYGIWLVKGF